MSVLYANTNTVCGDIWIFPPWQFPGMSDMSCDRNVILDDLIDMEAVSGKTHLWYGSAGRLSNRYHRDDDFQYRHIPEEDQGMYSRKHFWVGCH